MWKTHELLFGAILYIRSFTCEKLKGLHKTLKTKEINNNLSLIRRKKISSKKIKKI